jgi:hypothetical protein
MQSFDDPAHGAARVIRPSHASKHVSLQLALMAALGLAACAGPSPQVQVAAADASQPATAGSDASGPAATNESAATASQQGQPESADAAASGTSSPAAPASDAASAATAPPPPAEAPATPAPTASVPEAPQTEAAPQSVPSQTATTDSAPAASPPSAPEATQTAAAPPPASSQTAGGPSDIAPPGSGLATGRPYVVIRFTESNVDYEKALSEAVKRAVARKPNLAFDLVAVTPRAGTAEDLADLTEQAHSEAASVMKSLSDLGIGPDRVSVMTWTGQPTDVNEIRLYIR